MTDLTVRGSLLEVQTQLSAISAIIKARKEGGWPIFQSDEVWEYQNQRDMRVCFPKGVIVSVKGQNKPIQDVKKGDSVLTDEGWQKIIQCHKNEYSGNMTYLKAGKQTILCTANHPLYSDGGWRKACQLKVGDFLKTSKNEIVEITYRKNFSLFKSNNIPSVFLKKLVLTPILNGIMPIFAIYFNSYLRIIQREINRIASNWKLLTERYIQQFKGFTNLLLKRCFPFKRTITRKTTKLFINCTRAFSKLFSTISTLNNYGWSSTFFTAVMSIKPLFSSKYFATSFTFNIFSVPRSTFHTANPISMGNRFVDSKRFLTNWTNFSNILRRIITGSRTKRCIFTYKSNSKRFSTLNTNLLNPISFRKMKTFFTTIFSLTKRVFSISHIPKFFSTIKTGYKFRRMTIPIQLNHFHKGYIHVYNLSVDKRPTFFANNILVHNCPKCEEYGHQKEFRGDEIPTTFPYYVYQPGDPFTVYPMTHMPDLSKFYDAPCRCWMIWVNPLECLEARLHLEKLEVSGVV